MNFKHFSFLVALIFLFSFCFSVDSISGFIVPNQVNLDQKITATGFFTDSNNQNEHQLCGFYFLDADTNVLISRATSEYTTSTGRITLAGFTISEPLFKRGQEYTLVVECGDASAQSDFNVVQRETIAHVGQEEWDYVTNEDNTTTLGIWVFLGGFIIIFIVGIWKLISMKVRK